MEKRVVTIISALVLMAASSITLASQDELVAREYKIKAAYLYNLIKFINWPATVTHSDTVDNPHTAICVYGENPFADHLDKLNEKKAKGLPIKVSYIDQTSALDTCHLIFFTKTNPSPTEFLRQAINHPLLTVGEDSLFLENGGIVSLVVEQNNIQLHINLTQAKKLGFEISGNLLEIAKVIK
jgi:hypothetical protein